LTVDLHGFTAGYLAEVEEHLSAATKNLVAVDGALRRQSREPNAVRELFRSLHTIKGLSAMVEIDPVVAIAHEMETILRVADEAAGELSRASIDGLADGLRAIEKRVAAVAAGQPVEPAPPALLERLLTLQAGAELHDSDRRTALPPLPAAIAGKLSATDHEQLAQGVAAGRSAWRVDFVPSPSRAATGINITSVRERLARVAAIVKVLPMALPKSDQAPGGLAFAIIALGDDAEALREAAGAETIELLAAPASASGSARATPPVPFDEGAGRSSLNRSARLVRVDVARLDDAMEKLSALVVNRFRLQRAVAELRASGADVRALAEILAENGRQLRDLRASVMRARMVPMGELLERIPLLVRGLERSTGKQVQVRIDAGHAELDKAVAERLLPAIVHLVRNAVDHAIETPEERVRAGKEPSGVVAVTCHERSNNRLELSVRDDGRGIDRVAVAKKAGKPVPDRDDALMALLTLPGLSTRDSASSTSGRGMGMDIVRRIAVDELGGQLDLTTEPGRGTTFILRVPLTITIVDAFSFVVGVQSFVTPVSSIEEILEIDPARVIRSPGQTTDRRLALYERRGEAMPLVALDRIFKLPKPAQPPRKAMVVQRNGRPFGFWVDRMLGQQEVVVRPLEDPLVRVVGISGSTDLGDGKPTLVLDLVALCASLSEAA
jgi:two-component system chemotaxis sensor kinase CheA